MSTFLLGVQDPDGYGTYLFYEADYDLDAIRQFRVVFGFAWKIVQIWEVPSAA